MNGTGYPWGQDPTAYVAAFLTVADAVHRNAPTAAMVWARGALAVGLFDASGGSTPDFHDAYATRYDKPLAIVETAAFYRPGGGGDSESAIKTAWLDQVLAADNRSRFPLLRMLNWLEWRKMETEVNAVVDWRITADTDLRSAFLSAVSDGGFELGPAVPPGIIPAGCEAP
jgi:hypothetical protein